MFENRLYIFEINICNLITTIQFSKNKTSDKKLLLNFLLLFVELGLIFISNFLNILFRIYGTTFFVPIVIITKT